MQGGGRRELEAGGRRAGVGTACTQLRCTGRTCTQGGGDGPEAGEGSLCTSAVRSADLHAEGREGGLGRPEAGEGRLCTSAVRSVDLHAGGREGGWAGRRGGGMCMAVTLRNADPQGGGRGEGRRVMFMAIPLGMHGGESHSHIWWWFKSQVVPR